MIEFGLGSDQRPSFLNPDAYIDLCEEIDRNSSYSDWEGLTGIAEVTALLRNSEVLGALRDNAPDGGGGVDIRRRKVLRCLTAHWLYENIDQGGHVPGPEETVAFITNTAWLISSRFWCKFPA